MRARNNDLLTCLIVAALWCSATLDPGGEQGPVGIELAGRCAGAPLTELQVLPRQKSCQLRLIGPNGLLLSYSSTGCALPSLGVVFYRLPALTGTSDLADTHQFLPCPLPVTCCSYTCGKTPQYLSVGCLLQGLSWPGNPPNKTLFPAQHPVPLPIF